MATTPKKTGRPSLYTPEIAQHIIEQLSDGIPLRHICRADNMPAWRTVHDWIARDPILSASIARARELGADAIAEECLTIMDEKPLEVEDEAGNRRYDPGSINWNKNRVEQRLKLLAKWQPKKYGDKLALGGDADAPAIKTEVNFQQFDAVLEHLMLKRQSDSLKDSK